MNSSVALKLVAIDHSPNHKGSFWSSASSPTLLRSETHKRRYMPPSGCSRSTITYYRCWSSMTPGWDQRNPVITKPSNSYREHRREKSYSESIIIVIVVGLRPILGISRVRTVALLPVSVHEAVRKCWRSALNVGHIDNRNTYLVVISSCPGRRNSSNISGVPYSRIIWSKTGALSQRTDLTSSE